MKILAVETSCDETALAFLEAEGGLSWPRFKIKENFVSSQIAIHRPWGGVVPYLAKREHLKNLPLIFSNLMKAQKENLRPDLLAVTVGPGLEPALWTGINFVKDIQKNFSPKKIIGVNHLEGHLYSFLLNRFKAKCSSPRSNPLKILFPALALIISGGHTILLRLKSLTEWQKLGETRDDAVGEAFDKVAKMLGLPYPGGPEIQKIAEKGDPKALSFPRPMIYAKNYDFSFSGLKTAVFYFWRDFRPPKSKKQNLLAKADVAASFQQAVVDVLVAKIKRAIDEFPSRSILLSGGVAANKNIRRALAKTAREKGLIFLAPPFVFTSDNAAMIGVAAYLNFLQKKNHLLFAQGNLNL